MKVRTSKVNWSTGLRRIIDSVDLEVNPGEFVGLIGPNGSGKSTLLRLMYRYLRPESGFIYLGEQDISQMGSKEVARNVSAVAQERTSDFTFTVHEVVSMGRNPHKGIFETDNEDDRNIVHSALLRVGVLPLADRDFYTLSGGEKQRVLIALALAQQPKVLILDEPTNHLDLRYQFEILELVRSLGITIIAAMHDLNQAAAYCDRVYLLDKGHIITEGVPADVLTVDRIKTVYGVNVAIGTHPATGYLNIVFTGVNRPEAGE